MRERWAHSGDGEYRSGIRSAISIQPDAGCRSQNALQINSVCCDEKLSWNFSRLGGSMLKIATVCCGQSTGPSHAYVGIGRSRIFCQSHRQGRKARRQHCSLYNVRSGQRRLDAALQDDLAYRVHPEPHRIVARDWSGHHGRCDNALVRPHKLLDRNTRPLGQLGRECERRCALPILNAGDGRLRRP